MRKGTTQKGTCCITIAHRVGVTRKCIGFNNEYLPPKPKYEYKLTRHNLKEFDKQYIEEFFEEDGELEDTFEEGE